jgi:hypothetical protein
LLRDLSAIQSRQPPEANSPLVGRAVRKLVAATATTQAWMDYLAAKAAGNLQRA